MAMHSRAQGTPDKLKQKATLCVHAGTCTAISFSEHHWLTDVTFDIQVVEVARRCKNCWLLQPLWTRRQRKTARGALHAQQGCRVLAALVSLTIYLCSSVPQPSQRSPLISGVVAGFDDAVNRCLSDGLDAQAEMCRDTCVRR